MRLVERRELSNGIVIELYEGQRFYAIVNKLFEPLAKLKIRVHSGVLEGFLFDFVPVEKELFTYVTWISKKYGVNTVLELFEKECQIWESCERVDLLRKKINRIAKLIS